MKEKILGSVVMGVTSNEGVTKEKPLRLFAIQAWIHRCFAQERS